MSGQVPTIWWSMLLLVHPFVALGDRLDEAREERPHLEAVVEAERLLAAVGGREADADVGASAFDRGDELRRDVMGVDVDGHVRYFLSLSRSISDFSWPPSISIMVPLTMCISGEASMTTRFATSSTSAMRPIGIEDGASLSASS